MKAARLLDRGVIECQEADIPQLKKGEVLVQTTHASICGSDLHHVFTDLSPSTFPCPPGYPGHEAVGEVVESRSRRFAVGDAVLTVPYFLDARCFAEFQAVGEESLIPIPERLEPRRALMAQQLGTVLFAMKRFWRDGGAGTAVVIGQGSAGLMFVKQLKSLGVARIVASDLRRSRLVLSKGYGADVVVHAPRESVVEATMELTSGAGADLVVEAAGTDQARTEAVRAVAERGHVGLFGLPEARDERPFPVHTLFFRQATLTSSVGAQREPGLNSFREALAQIEAGHFDVAPLMTHSLDLERIREALDIAHEKPEGMVKLVIDFDHHGE